MREEEEIFEIWIDSIVENQENKKIDIEKDFQYLNPFFFFIAFILLWVFILQVQNWLFHLWDEIDLQNITYKYSNYREWWSVFWIFTSIFLHWSVWHIIWNLLFFYIFWLVMYRIFSFSICLLMFLWLWILAGIPSYFINSIPSIWASWAIFWIFWITTVFYFLNKNFLENNLGDIAWALLIIAWYQFFLWFTHPIIDNSAHISWYFSWLLIWYIILKYTSYSKKITV